MKPGYQFLFAVVGALVGFATTSDAEILIKNDFINKDAIHRDLIGLRKLPDSKLFLVKSKNKIEMRTSVFYASAKNIEEVKATIQTRHSNVDDALLPEILRALNSWNEEKIKGFKYVNWNKIGTMPTWNLKKGTLFENDSFEAALVRSNSTVVDSFKDLGMATTHSADFRPGEIYPLNPQTLHDFKPTPVSPTVSISQTQTTVFDAKLVSGLFATELFEGIKPPIIAKAAKGKPLSIEINKSVTEAVYSAATALTALDLYSNAFESNLIFVKSNQTLGKYPAFYGQAKVTLATVSFGLPILHEPKEMGINIPDSLNAKYDVYFCSFSLSDRRFFDDALSEIVYAIRLPQSAIALELVPLAYGTVERKTATVGTPEIEVGTSTLAVKLGQIYGNTISFEEIKPKIVGAGLQQHEFSWSMRDDAAGPGAKKFVALVPLHRDYDSLTGSG